MEKKISLLKDRNRERVLCCYFRLVLFAQRTFCSLRFLCDANNSSFAAAAGARSNGKEIEQIPLVSPIDAASADAVGW